MTSIDDITLDDIFSGIQKQNEKFDAKKIDRLYHELFPDQLLKYEFIPPLRVQDNISVGSVIRYVKTNNDISCVSIVKSIVYTYEYGEKILDYFILSTVHYSNSIWRLYPSNYYIFKYSRNIADQKFINKLLKLNEEKGIKTKNITISPKDRHKLLKNLGLTDKEIALDDKVDNLIRYEGTKKVASYTNKRVNLENLDDVCNDIMEHHSNRKKK